MPERNPGGFVCVINGPFRSVRSLVGSHTLVRIGARTRWICVLGKKCDFFFFFTTVWLLNITGGHKCSVAQSHCQDFLVHRRQSDSCYFAGQLTRILALKAAYSHQPPRWTFWKRMKRNAGGAIRCMHIFVQKSIVKKLAHFVHQKTGVHSKINKCSFSDWMPGLDQGWWRSIGKTFFGDHLPNVSIDN